MTAHVVNVLLGGVFHAAILFLVAAGLQVVFGVQKIFNLACGSFYALGAYVGVSAVQAFTGAGGPPALFLIPLVAGGLLVGAVGVLRSIAIATYPEVEMLLIYLIVIAVLILRPRGLFGTAAA